ncbi:MAG: redoxin domain-containing protein [Bacteroidales bacterium]
MKNLKLYSMLLAAGCFLILSVSCRKAPSPTLTAQIDGLKSEKIYVQYIPLNISDSVLYDTLQAENGKFIYTRPFNSLAQLIIEVDKDRVLDSRGQWEALEAYRMEFLVQAGETIQIEGKYEDGFLSYVATGSEEIAVQAALRNESKELCKEIAKVEGQLKELYAKELQEMDETLADSLYERRAKLIEQQSQKRLEYVKNHADKVLSGFYLLLYPEIDTIEAYYNTLSEKVRNGDLKSKFEKALSYANLKKELERNRAKVIAGAMAPNFTLLNLEGKAVKLSDLKGKYVVLDFWGTWCSWCVKGIPSMKKYYDQYKKKVEFVGIACKDKKEKVEAMVKEKDMKWIQLLNGEGAENVSQLYGVEGYPTKIILTPEGEIVDRFIGEDEDFYTKLGQCLRK